MQENIVCVLTLHTTQQHRKCQALLVPGLCLLGNDCSKIAFFLMEEPAKNSCNTLQLIQCAYFPCTEWIFNKNGYSSTQLTRTSYIAEHAGTLGTYAAA